jgi:hypothetical protein
MDPRDPKTEYTAKAIALLTAVIERSDGPSDLAMDLHREAFMADELPDLTIGLQNLAVWLLVKLENATGQSAAEILQDIARRNERPR